jgi:soluble lytic murein transglycosylase
MRYSLPAMPRLTPLLPALALLAACHAAPAAANDPSPAIRAHQWPQAQAEVANAPDPVAAKLVAYYRLLTPGAATPQEIAAFMAANPNWPNQTQLNHRRQEAIAAGTDPAQVLAACADRPIILPAALSNCAAAEADGGQKAQADQDARAAWRAGLDSTNLEPFLKRFGPILTSADQEARFDHLAWIDPTAAATQIPHLPKTQQPAAKIRLALIANAPDALAKAEALPPSESLSPGFVLDEARALRKAKQNDAALNLWKEKGFKAEQDDPDHHSVFWKERDILARDLLTDNDIPGALLLANDQLPGASLIDQAESDFLTGFIALRRAHDPDLAIDRFSALATLSKAAISQARAQYWLGLAEQAAGQNPDKAFQAAAAWPTTFYGQIAAHTLGQDPAAAVKTLRDPTFSPQQTWALLHNELIRAALTLISWGEQGHARAFMLQATDQAAPTDQALCARLALALGMPDTAVFIARRIGLEGGMLPDAGWPIPVDPPSSDINPAIVLAVIRQESSFDHGVISNAGARGLMQLLPATARLAGGTGPDPAALADPTHNMALGENVLSNLLARFSGSLPLAVAAYNAGPQKVDKWLAKNGDPRTGAIDMIDWIELITYGETRNYVQRVLESVVIYSARRNQPDTSLIAQWMPRARHDG